MGKSLRCPNVNLVNKSQYRGVGAEVVAGVQQKNGSPDG